MYQIHNFNVGVADNLVNVKEMLDKLENTMNELQCIFCERIIKNYNVLRAHMRKKKHYKLNPRNSQFDKFYLVNYLEQDKNWKDLEKEEDDDSITEDDSESENNYNNNNNTDQDQWDDWEVENNEEMETSCLFCTKTTTNVEDCLNHCKQQHNFDLVQLENQLNLDIYGNIKLINYIRQQVINNTCIYCNTKYNSNKELMEHMEDQKHFTIDKSNNTYLDDQ